MLNSRPVRLFWHHLNRLTRLAIIATTVTAMLCAITILVMRYWLLPNIEQFHDKITASLSLAIGNPVTIGKIEGDWTGMSPRLNFTDVNILDNQGQPALVLPRINASVSWLSLPAAELRMASLEIDRPALLIRRDTEGKIYIGSVAISSGRSDNNLANWLLHQSRMVVRNAVIVWVDEQHGAPPLMLDQVNLRIESLFSHHQFALKAVPPIELASPLDIRGDFHGKRIDDLNHWRGQIFAQLDYTDLLAWRPWLKLPEQLSSGRGSLRGWLGIEAGKIAQITTDLALRDVATRLSDDVPVMGVHYLHGRATWKTINDGWEVSTRNLSMQLDNGLRLQPTDFYLQSYPVGKSHPAGGAIRANTLQLESLVNLANFFPLETQLRSQLNAYAPRGRVSNLDMQWQVALDKLLNYQIKGQFENLAMQQVGKLPGFTGLSVAVDGNESNGRLNFNTQDMTVNAPGIMREALEFHNLTGQASWQHEKGELLIRADNMALANDDLSGTLFGSFQSKAGTLGLLDLTVNLTRADLRRAARYTPLIALDKNESNWLNNAMQSGHSEDFHLRIKGNLSDFPLDGTRETFIEMGAHAQDLAVKFAPDWPVIDNLSGELIMRNNKLEVQSQSANMMGVQVHHLSVSLPDMRNPDMPLEIKGEADGTNNTFLQFIQQSPVHGYINDFTDGMNASGNGHLQLFARIPLQGTKPPKVSGVLRIPSSDIDLGAGAPWLRNTHGELAFTESAMQANNVAADILGGPAHMNVQTVEGGTVRANAQGRINLEVLRRTETHPLLAFLHGSTSWDANISVVKKIPQIVLNSNLAGISSSLPAPLTKRSNEVWPLRIEKKNIADGQDQITAQIGKLLNARVMRSEENGVSVIKRGLLNFGAQYADKPLSSAELKPGLWLAGNLPELSLQGWGALGGGSEGATLPIAGANLHIDKFSAYGLKLTDLQISSAKRGDGLTTQLSSAQLNGEVSWLPQSFNGSGKITARLRNLYWAGDSAAAPATLQAAAPPAKPAESSPRKLPAMEISIDDLLYKGKQIGHFDLTGYPEGSDWRLRRLHITNPDGSITGDGLWHTAQARSQTQLNLLMDISNAGKILARSGYPNTVKNGSGKLAASLSWNGQPDDFNYATLDGTLKLDTGKGQFLKMDPGIGKLLGILSLQALPKRITLDFTDVFSSGFEFDNINGNATLKNGVMQTQDLHIDGSSAKVTMKGIVNLNDETQNLRVEVLPTIGSSVSMLSAFAGGPVVGIGALIMNKVLGNPLDKLVSFEYNVSGTWSDPNVIKVGETPVKTSPAANSTNTN
jgi:uncharacterized protein (TIGR02099 family)